MLKLVVGLGNPGRQYEKTRHNVGFLFLDRLAADVGLCWARQSRFDGFVAVSNAQILFLKPDTFMNRSGCSVGKLVRYYKILPEEVLVVHDELDFNVGVVKLKKGGGHAGHNGLRDIIANLGSGEFYRLRVGIGRPVSGKSVSDYVLSAPPASEMELLSVAFDLSIGLFDQMVVGDMAAAMNKLNA
ncbi:MAG: aminoacyl-tRNA hydrolase [Methylovulum sp.]